MSSSSNKRIVKNTLYLYLRMFVTMIVSLYTARVVLLALGADDYGIYNVVGGIVVLFSFLNTAMSNATQRFLSYELGKGVAGDLERTFSMSVTCHAILAFSILVIAETIGLWFVITQLNIPEGREFATFWVYQFSVATFVTSILRVPYNASVISHERMSFYAYLSIADVFLNLGVAFLIVYGSFDKLILYAGLKYFITLFCWLANYIYCKKIFTSCDYHLFWDKKLFKKLISFSGWSMLGGGSVIVTQGGSNILINIFCGVAVNAAYGIANQVSSVIYGFVSNFQLAFQPQIVKLYAEEKTDEQIRLINRASLFSYYLLLIICIPFIINADVVLRLWLKDVPTFASDFCIWMLVYCLIDAIQAPLWMAIGATGNIKNYSIWSSAISVLNLPIACIVLYFGWSPVGVFIIRAIINMILAIIRVFYVKGFLGFPSSIYLKMVLVRAVPVTLFAGITSYYLRQCYFGKSLVDLIVCTSISILIVLSTILSIGMKQDERTYLYHIIKNKIRK